MSKSGVAIRTALSVLLTLAANSSGKYSGGLGTEAEPFRISAVSDWEKLMTTPADWASHFVLTADMDLNDVPITPIGNDAYDFTGVFDGNDYVIRNADVNMPGSDLVGVFGCLGRYGQIRNLWIADVAIAGGDCVGGLLGLIRDARSGGGTVVECYSSGSVVGTSLVGGLVGYNGWTGTISNCCSTASVRGTGDYVGGLVGTNSSYGNIVNCYSTGFVSTTGDYVGGVVGRNDGSISNCYSSGWVGGTGAFVGGLAGFSYRGIVNRSFWDVNTSGRLGSSGGKGVSTERMKSVIIYRNAGWTANGWVIEDGGDYPHLAWEGTPGVPIPEPEPVPLLGDGTEQSPYQIWTSEDFAILSWHILVLDKHIELKADLDLAGIALYPIGDLGGFVGVFDGNGYVIRNADVNRPGSDYVGLFGYLATEGQIKNLEMEDVSVVGSNNVGGLVGRNGGTITNCYLSGSVSGSDGLGGLAGWNYEGAVTNCHSSGSVTGTGFGVGGLLGYSYSATINDCYSNCLVSGTSIVGGLVGENWNGTISGCYSSSSVSGTGAVGGLVGYNCEAAIRNCCSTGSVKSTEGVGGLVGANSRGTISNSYSSGLVKGTGNYVGGLVESDYRGAIISSFWDIETSDCNTSAGGTPKTTAEMKTQSTFTEAGWDFIGETANGSEDIWAICEGRNYPRLVWQIPAADWICPDGVGLEDFSYFGGVWGSGDPSPVNLDGEDGIGFGDLMIFCEQWLSGR